MGEDVCDLNRSYGRRIQSKIVKRCPGGIESMPTAEQAMMRMLLVCLFVCLCMSGCLPSCLAAFLPVWLPVWGSACGVLGHPRVDPPFPQQNPQQHLRTLKLTPTPSLLQDSGVDNAASLSAHEMMERVTQQVNHCAPNIAKTRLDQFMG